MRTSRNYFAAAVALLIEIVADDGTHGYGYSDLFTRAGEEPAPAGAIAVEIFDATLRDGNPLEIEPLVARLEARLGANIRLLAGFEMALQDLRGKLLGVPVYEMLGGAVRSRVTVMRMVGLKRPDEMAEEAVQLCRRGIKALKLKIGTGCDEDVERVRQVRAAVGEEVFLKVDANQAYTFEEALRVARQLEKFRVETFEQPLQADDWEGMIRLTRESPVPVEADQTVKSVEDAIRVIREGAAKVITTSPQKVGGIFRAKRVADLCEAAGMACIVSNVGGSRLNDAAACQVIACSAAARLPCEVGEFERLTADPAKGLEVIDGEIQTPTGPGLGVDVEF
jgi:L-alanine-DL-glutamate epimerase-like enolase superfamily enzyme